MNSGQHPASRQPSIWGSDPDWTLLFLAWLIATASTLGSLFFSYVMELPPCVLCWYQRICLFPLVIIIARGLFPLDRQVIRYALPLTAEHAALRQGRILHRGVY
jgi:disulfide bond formation protein DsbB